MNPWGECALSLSLFQRERPGGEITSLCSRMCSLTVYFPPFSWQDYFESYISIASTVPSVLCLVGNFLLVNK